MVSVPQGEFVAAYFSIREGIGLSTSLPHPFGAFPKPASWLMLSFDGCRTKARPKSLIEAWDSTDGGILDRF
jgi:hypothetical protein